MSFFPGVGLAYWNQVALAVGHLFDAEGVQGGCMAGLIVTVVNMCLSGLGVWATSKGRGVPK